MKRETFKKKTPSGEHEIVFNAWLTGREKRAISRPFKSVIEVQTNMREQGEQEAKMGGMKMGEAMEKSEDIAISKMIISVDGESENILERILNMKSEDYDFVVEVINEITKGKDFMMPGGKQ